MEKVEKKIENLSNNILGTEKGRSSKLSSKHFKDIFLKILNIIVK